MTRRSALLLLLVAPASCYTLPRGTPPARAPIEVRAPFARTWSAIIDIFAERGVPLTVVDRSSGFAATAELPADRSTRWADCGSDALEAHVGPSFATWNVRIRGDSVRASASVTVHWGRIWGSGSLQKRIDCVTTGAWEEQVEAEIKARAESR